MSDFIAREELILNAKRASAACILLRRPACLTDDDTCYFLALWKVSRIRTLGRSLTMHAY